MRMIRISTNIFLGTIALFFLSLSFAHAQVSISEIAWMGTTTSTADEWVELHNDGSSPVDLGGWVLESIDGTPHINLSGTIGVNGYALLERTDDTTVPGISAFLIYVGALSNGGENLVLKDAGGITIDSVDASGGWVAGNSSTFETMQKSSSSWITAVATPNAATSTSSNPPPENNNPPTDNSGDDTPEVVPVVSQKTKDPIYKGQMISPTGTIVAGVPSLFQASITRDDGTKIQPGRFIWSFGDGTQITKTSDEQIVHIYVSAGSYVAVLRYFASSFDTKPTILLKKEFTVLPAGVQMTRIDKGYQLLNTTTSDIDLGSWKITSGANSFVIPEYTIVKSKSSIVIPFETIGFRFLVANLITPDGNIASSLSIPPITTTSIGSSINHTRVVHKSSFVSNLETLDTTPQAEAAGDLTSTPEATPRHTNPLIYFILLLSISLAGFVWYTLRHKKPAYEVLKQNSTTESKDLEDVLYYDDN